jgi:hypothetical protein
MAKDPKPSEPFVSQQDRPNVTADTPVSELRVRDLHQILAGTVAQKVVEKTHLDKVQKEFDKTHPDKLHKEFKEIEKIVKDTDGKHLKDIIDQIIVKTVPEAPPDPTRVGGDPIERLQNSVDSLASEVAALKARMGG